MGLVFEGRIVCHGKLHTDRSPLHVFVIVAITVSACAPTIYSLGRMPTTWQTHPLRVGWQRSRVSATIQRRLQTTMSLRFENCVGRDGCFGN
jgi:hypothetical protein